jgi:NADPH:quinone reductase-like Zn-dependent oxidoreductase
MKAIRIRGRGGPDHLVHEEVPKPSPRTAEVLVRVAASGILYLVGIRLLLAHLASV